MKRFIYLIALFCLSNLAQAGAITKIYSFDAPTTVIKGDFVFLNLPGCKAAGLIGTPALPYQHVSLLLPPGTEATGFSLELSDPFEMDVRLPLYPVQPPRPYSLAKETDFVADKIIYGSMTAFPTESKGRLETHFICGHSVAMATFTPVVYFPAEGKVLVYRKAEVKMDYRATNRAIAALSNMHPGQWAAKRVAGLVQNPESQSDYVSDKVFANPFQVLIVTPQAYTGAFQDLALMYEAQGLAVQVSALEDIQQATAGIDPAEKLRNFIIAQYQAHGIEYVVLGGDAELVPIRGFYCQVQSSSLYSDDNIPSDLYYSSLDGTWNDNGNNLWGEPGEDDLLPEVAVGRLPFSSIAELNRMLHKTIQYQTNPVPGEFERPLLAGELLYNNPLSWGADYLDLLIGYQDENGYVTNGIPETYDIDKLYERDMGYWSKFDLITRINAGRAFVHHAGHSNWDYAMKLYITDISNQTFSQVNGITRNFTLVYTHGCICGAFDYSDCIAEEMLKIDNFAVAGAFNSRYGWFNEGQTEGPSAHLHREFVNALYTDGYNRVGATHQQSRIMTAPWVTAPGQWEEGALRWSFYCCNILGDPALKIWTDNITGIDLPLSGKRLAEIENNPANGSIRMRMQTDGPVTFELSDLTGKTVKVYTVQNQKNATIDVSSIQNGVYLLVLKTPTTNENFKVLILNR
jgi:hypothetical protein